MSRKLAGNWLIFIAGAILIALLLVFGGKVGAQEAATEAAPVVVTPEVTPDAAIGGFIDRLDPNIFVIVLLIAGGLFAVLNHFKHQAWVEALRDSVPSWVREPVADALDGGSDIVLDELERRAAETSDTYDDEQVAQLRRRMDSLELWVRGNAQSVGEPPDAAGTVRVNQHFPQG